MGSNLCNGFLMAASLPFFSFATSEKGIVLKNQFSILKANGYMAKAYYCEDCNMVVAFAETKDRT